MTGTATRMFSAKPHQRDVLPVAVVVVVGHITVLAVLDVARGVGVGVPDRGALAVLAPGPSTWYEEVATPQ
jgi:hypothetical protein